MGLVSIANKLPDAAVALQGTFQTASWKVLGFIKINAVTKFGLSSCPYKGQINMLDKP